MSVYLQTDDNHDGHVDNVGNRKSLYETNKMADRKDDHHMTTYMAETCQGLNKSSVTS